jgi:hypothetical protein
MCKDAAKLIREVANAYAYAKHPSRRGSTSCPTAAARRGWWKRMVIVTLHPLQSHIRERIAPVHMTLQCGNADAIRARARGCFTCTAATIAAGA